MRFNADVDIDLPDRNIIKDIFPNITLATIVKNNGESTPHASGVYFQKIPKFAINNQSTIEYNTAQELGFFKVDFLNLHLYKNIHDTQHLEKLLAKEPNWKMLEDESIVVTLFHLANHVSLCKQMKPTTIDELAMLLAVIRPSKRHLIGKTWDEIKQNIWVKENSGYEFKRSHAISYATVIAVQMNLIEEEKLGLLSD